MPVTGRGGPYGYDNVEAPTLSRQRLRWQRGN
jgi:hypothetical protein